MVLMLYSDVEQQQLLTVARTSIQHGLTKGRAFNPQITEYSANLQAVRASFVTLNIAGELRGCIGTATARLPLVSDVAQHAYAAAFSDPRFPPLTQPELSQITLHISILNPPELMQFDSEAGLLQQLRPHIDGLILRAHAQQALFLPAVWAVLPEPTQFVQRLKLKAGLPSDYWSNTLQAQRFTTESIAEPTTRE